MSDGRYWLSRVIPREEIARGELVRMGGLDPYRQHQALWKLFDLPPKEARGSKNPTPFLFRAERIEPASAVGHRYPCLVGLPVFYLLSQQIPRDSDGIWHIETPDSGYRPDIREGDRLSFKLRANPVVARKAEREERNQKTWLENRQALGLTEKPDTTKRIRHDVVMDAKRQSDWKNLPPDQRPPLSTVAYEAGSRWLEAKALKLGFKIEPVMTRDDVFGDEVELPALRVDGYSSWRQRYGKKIALSTLDFEGHLIVTDPVKFKDALYRGIGPAKSFGCGLLLVRRLV